MDNKTLRDYFEGGIETFGEKSASADNFNENNYLSRLLDYANSPYGSVLTGIILPGGGGKKKLMEMLKKSTLGKAATQGSKNVMDILKMLVGKKVKSIDDYVPMQQRISPGDIPFPPGDLKNIIYRPGKEAVDLNVPAYIRKGFKNVETGQGKNLPAVRQNLLPSVVEDKSKAAIVQREVERNRDALRSLGEALGKDTGKGYYEVNIEDLAEFLLKKN